MSTGGIIGGIAGGVIGFFIGGPVGAAIGAGIGAGIGMYIDPVEPDTPSPGEPGTVSVNLAREGSPLFDCLGTVKVNASIIWSCCSRSVEVKEQVEGGKGGGSQEVTTGYEYFLTWAVGICRGPVSKLFTIYANDKIVYDGELEAPASGGVVTISLDGMGTADFYFGTDDQEPNAYWKSKASDSTLIPGLRGLCYMVLKDCSLGNYNRAPSLFVVVNKSPSFEADGLDDDYKDVETFDYNVAHAVYYALNKMIGIASDYLHASSFNEAALTLMGESRGISVNFNQHQEALTYVESMLIHVSAGLRWSGDSKLHFFLFRKNENTDDLLSFGPDDFLDRPLMTRKSWLETFNEFKVQYSKRIFREKICPSGCDGFEFLSGSGALQGNETVHFQIQNPDWKNDPEECTDFSFLSDGLSEEKRGSFYNFTPLGSGRWQIAYRTNPNLCDGQEDPARECPLICGFRLACCRCEDYGGVGFSMDSDLSGDSIAQDGSTKIYWQGGQGPFTLELTEPPGYPGQGFSFHYNYELKEISTNQREIAVYCDVTACGGANVKIVDICGYEINWGIRCTTGQWNLVEDLDCAELIYYGGDGTCTVTSECTVGWTKYRDSWVGGTNINARFQGPGCDKYLCTDDLSDNSCYAVGFEFPFNVVDRVAYKKKWIWGCPP